MLLVYIFAQNIIESVYTEKTAPAGNILYRLGGGGLDHVPFPSKYYFSQDAFTVSIHVADIRNVLIYILFGVDMGCDRHSLSSQYNGLI